MLSLWAAVPAFLLCTAARYFQIIAGTDFNYGSLYDDNGFLMDFSFYGLLILFAAVSVGLALMDKKKSGAFHINEISGFVDEKTVLLGFPLVVTGALAAYDGYAQTMTLTPSAFLIFVDFLMGAVMLVLGFVILWKKELTPFLGFSLAAPAIYYTLKGIALFSDRMAIASIPEYLIEALNVVGCAVFFMQLAKLLSGNESKSTRVILTASGTVTAVMTLSSALATVLADLSPDSVAMLITPNSAEAEAMVQKNHQMNHTLYVMSYTPWVDVAAALCIVFALVALYIKNRPQLPAEIAEVTEE